MDDKQRERFHGFIADWLRNYISDYYTWMSDDERDVAKVTRVREEERAEGYCETCYYEYTEVVIRYEDSNGNEHEFTYRGSMAGMLGFD